MCQVQNHEDKKILVVDDEEAVRYLLDIALSDKGYSVFYAEGAEEALGILSDENIDVMFLDLNLPDMSGVELCRRIRKDRPNAIINAITGYSMMFDITECYRAGFDDYFEKPISLYLLMTSVLKAFKKRKKRLRRTKGEMMRNQEL